MTRYVVTAEEERVDRIAKALYGTERGGTLEAVLAANPGLADLGPFAPLGTVIEAPERPATVTNPVYVRPWE